MQVPMRIYYDKTTGMVIEITGNFKDEGLLEIPTVEQDIQSYKRLSIRNRESFDYIELPFGSYSEDFKLCSGYRVNPETRQLEFSYPDPNQPSQEPLYQNR